MKSSPNEPVNRSTAAQLAGSVANQRPFAMYGIALAVICIAAAAANTPTTLSLFTEWNNTASLTYTHGYLVAGISLWLLWRVRRELQREPLAPSRWAALFSVLCGLVSLVAQRGGIELGHQLMLPFIFWVGILATFGWSFARRCVFPVGYLYFAIPIWSLINDKLQWLTIAAVRLMLRATAVPAHFDGEQIDVPAGTFRIEGGCSGLHFVIVALALAALYGEMRGASWWMRVRLLALAGGLAVAGNWLRVYIIILAGHLSDMQNFLITVDHYYFGWFVFSLAMTAFFFLSPDFESAAVSTPGSTVKPTDSATLSALVTATALAVAAISVAPVAAWSIGGGTASGLQAARLPLNPAGWAGPDLVSGNWKPVFIGADSEVQGVYRSGVRELRIYVATYLVQEQGKELIGFMNSTAGSLRVLQSARVSAPPMKVNEQVIAASTGINEILWSYYTIGNAQFASGLAAQLWYGAVSLYSSPVSRAVVMRAQCGKDCNAARDELASILPSLGAMDAL